MKKIDKKNGMKELIYQLESSLLRAEVRQSATKLNQLIADDFVEFGSSGNIYHKKDVIGSLASATAKIEDFEVTTLSSDVLLATYKIKSDSSISLRSSIWKHSQEGWRMIFHQGTKCENQK
jgi:hypothetical protein